MPEVQVEFLFWPQCPSHSKAKTLLEQSMAKLGLNLSSIRSIEIVTQEDAIAAGFVGSPTIRINGRDIQLSRDEPSLSCRIYHRRNGQISALPDPEDLDQALRQALSENQSLRLVFDERLGRREIR